MKEKIVCKILQIDKPNLNGNVYSREILEENIIRLRESIDTKNLLGEFKTGSNNSVIIWFSNVSHLINDIRLEDEDLVVEYTLLDTPMGKIAQKLMENGMILRLTPRGVGNIKDNIVQENYKLITFDICGYL